MKLAVYPYLKGVQTADLQGATVRALPENMGTKECPKKTSGIRFTRKYDIHIACRYVVGLTAVQCCGSQKPG